MYKKTSAAFCDDSLSNIEGFEKASTDMTQWYVLHHRLETERGLSARQLIEMDLYYARPASELIFITRKEHARIHGEARRKPKQPKVKQPKIIVEFKGETREFTTKKAAMKWIDCSSTTFNNLVAGKALMSRKNKCKVTIIDKNKEEQK